MRSNSIVWTLTLLLFLVGMWGVQQVGQRNVPTLSRAPRVLGTAVTDMPAVNGICHEKNGLPDPVCTPGSVNLIVTQANINSTICTSGYTKTIRPPSSYTQSLKRQQIIAYGYLDKNLSDYEEDHLISLELGGNPTDPKNLWPEPGASPNLKDSIENICHEKVCTGQISLQEAQKEIATNWKVACQ